MSINISKNSEIKQILALDYGKSKVGLAMANTENKIAFTYATLKNDKDFWQKLAEIIQKEDIKTIIIGISEHVKLKENEYKTREFGEELAKKFTQIKIEYQNEMFTTKMAEANLIERGAKKIKNFDDQESARIILQSWLEKS